MQQAEYFDPESSHLNPTLSGSAEIGELQDHDTLLQNLYVGTPPKMTIQHILTSEIFPSFGVDACPNIEPGEKGTALTYVCHSMPLLV